MSALPAFSLLSFMALSCLVLFLQRSTISLNSIVSSKHYSDIVYMTVIVQWGHLPLFIRAGKPMHTYIILVVVYFCLTSQKKT